MNSNQQPQLLEDSFNFFDCCGLVSTIMALYYNNDFRKKVDDFYNNPTDENLNKIFPEIPSPTVFNLKDRNEINELNKKKRLIVNAIRYFWMAHIRGSEFCSPFGKIWAFNKLAEAFDVPERMYQPNNAYRVPKKTSTLQNLCKNTLKSDNFPKDEIKSCNDLWQEIKDDWSKGHGFVPVLYEIFTDNNGNKVKIKDKGIIPRIFNESYGRNDGKYEKKQFNDNTMMPKEVAKLLTYLGARIDTTQYPNEEDGCSNCIVDNISNGHHSLFVTFNGKMYKYKNMGGEMLEQHKYPEEQDKKMVAKIDEDLNENNYYNSVFTEPIKNLFEPDPKLCKDIEKYKKINKIKKSTAINNNDNNSAFNLLKDESISEIDKTKNKKKKDNEQIVEKQIKNEEDILNKLLKQKKQINYLTQKYKQQEKENQEKFHDSSEKFKQLLSEEKQKFNNLVQKYNKQKKESQDKFDNYYKQVKNFFFEKKQKWQKEITEKNNQIKSLNLELQNLKMQLKQIQDEANYQRRQLKQNQNTPQNQNNNLYNNYYQKPNYYQQHPRQNYPQNYNYPQTPYYQQNQGYNQKMQQYPNNGYPNQNYQNYRNGAYGYRRGN